jgi:cytochrome b6-f complex iron-sulfur subunit
VIRHQDENKAYSRRQFLGAGLAASFVALLGQAGVALFDFFKPRIKPGSFGSVVNAGQVDEFEPGSVSHILGGRCYITRLEDGGFLALWQRCTHLGCTIPWQEAEGEFNCPCHSSIFNPVGEVLSGPAPRPMDLFPIEIVDSEILVNTGEPIQRDDFEPSQVTYA